MSRTSFIKPFFRLLCALLIAASPLASRPRSALAAPGAIVRCSTDKNGEQPEAQPSWNPSISADDRYVAFQSRATGLVAGDTNNAWDVFRKDLQTGEIVRCSTDKDGKQATGDSERPAISADGRYVAFVSSAADLVPGDTNNAWDVFRKDLQTGEIVRCSTDKDGKQAENGDSNNPAISADGRYVAFESRAVNLVGDDTNNVSDVFRKDLQTGAIVRCSTDKDGKQAETGTSFNPSISADGRYVAFESGDPKLVPGDTNGWPDIFRKDPQTGAIVICSTDKDGKQANGKNFDPAISADGRYVAFQSNAEDLVAGDTNGVWDVFRKDLQTGEIVRCSTDRKGNQAEIGISIKPSISADGRYVAFVSSADNLVPDDTNGVSDVFRKDLQTGEIVRCSTDKDGKQADIGDIDQDASLNADGKYAAFDSPSAKLVPDDTNGTWDVFRKELALPVPHIESISPQKGEAGTEVTVKGKDFRDLPMGGYVSFGDTRASECLSWSDKEIKVKVPAGLQGVVPVTVTTGGGASNAVDFTVPYRLYFAEGYTGSGFREYLCLGQPVDAPLVVRVTYLFRDGSYQENSYSVPGLSRLTVDVNSEVGSDREVSMVCEADWPFIAERPMYFSYQGGWTGGHDAVGATSTSTTWYFAEGYTGPGFEEWICVLNPGDADAALTFRFQTQEEGEKTVTGLSVPARSRGSFKANDLLAGGSYQTSLALESTVPVVAERPMYFSYSGTGGFGWTGGHCVMGATALSREYFFAEGTTRAGFEEWLTLQNPGDDPIDVHAVFNLGEGSPVERDYKVPAHQRSTVLVNDPLLGVGPEKDVSVRLVSDHLFLAERPMYFSYPGLKNWGWEGGHCVMGATRSAREWFFAEGYTGSTFEEWICIQNPGAEDAAVAITYYPEGAQLIAPGPFKVRAGTRATICVNYHAAPDLSLSAYVSSDRPVICERPMYFSYGLAGLEGGHDVMGFAP